LEGDGEVEEVEAVVGDVGVVVEMCEGTLEEGGVASIEAKRRERNVKSGKRSEVAQRVRDAMANTVDEGRLRGKTRTRKS